MRVPAAPIWNCHRDLDAGEKRGQVISPCFTEPRDILTILVEKQYIEMIPIDIAKFCDDS